ncbi:hypothetical protein EK21DRAFT_104780 [Setomelanomma holmii]|uniref:Telomeric single stranded DNA binding POT1/Cdc13 domain-containing protein n=1 Tax=Setomelanomma holmii TaxID=210430 RepID=A0A9P4GZ04_9PLEO|nr:hypothetical protein EK21DRAFT_104780 [Setomelanomma holmii]
MALTHIAELNPELARDSTQFKAAVTLIWPYSSSQRQFALLLAEPDFRLRRKKGQVRARFSGSSAKALATTGVGIGDEVVLSLTGAQFVKEGTVSTPGRSIDWELEYTQTVAIQVFRDGSEIARLDLVDVAPTPAPRSPVRREAIGAPSPAQQWSSPAFLKRARLFDGPFFEAPFDPLADENAEGHDKKRRRKSYRDWKAWTYSARTPSPEKGDVNAEVDLAEFDASPSRPTQFPNTPVSPPKPGVISVAAGPFAREGSDGPETGDGQASIPNLDGAQDAVGHKRREGLHTDDFVRDQDFYELYAGPDEQRPEASQFAFGGDTEANTEEEDSLDPTDGASLSATEVNTEDLEEEPSQAETSDVAQNVILAQDTAAIEPGVGSAREDDSFMEVLGSHKATEDADEHDTTTDDPLAEEESLERAHEASAIVMPPPTLPALDTTFSVPATTSGLLTPIGREPASPTLQPLDSALLPLPSPFPGEPDANVTSYLDHIPDQQPPAKKQIVQEQELPSGADYIEENSFFSSIGSSKNPAMHPFHESAFTPVRFTFGMDGAGWSRPLELSSPAPDEISKHNDGESVAADDVSHDNANSPASPAAPTGVRTVVDTVPMDKTPAMDVTDAAPPAEEVMELSSDSESDDSENSEDEEYSMASKKLDMDADDDDRIAQKEDQEQAVSANDSHNAILAVTDHPNITPNAQLSGVPDIVEQEPTSTQKSAAVSDVVDLGSPSDSSDVEEAGAVSQHEYEIKSADDRPSTLQADLSVQDLHVPQEINTTIVPTDLGSHNFIADTYDFAPTHTSAQQELEHLAATSDSNQPPALVGLKSQMDVQDSEMLDLDDIQSHDISQWVPDDMEDLHPDIKMESIEDGPVFYLAGMDTQEEPGDSVDTATTSQDKVFIDVPEDGHRFGKMHTTAVPATGPARNTRSKTKASTSPTKEDPPVSKRTTRSTRSKASSAHSVTAGVELSQELNAPQGRYSNVSFVKDSEEESLHSEKSLSTVKYSDDWNVFTNFSDPVVANEQDAENEDIRPPPATAPEHESWVGAKTKWNKSELQVVVKNNSSPSRPQTSFVTQLPASSPHRKPRSGSSEATLTSPVTRTTRRHVYTITSSPPQSIDNAPEESTPKASHGSQVAYPALPGDSETDDVRSSPPTAVEIGEAIHSSHPAVTPTLPSPNQQSLVDSHKPMTPEATQRTDMESQHSRLTDQQLPTLPMTPQLTQATSTADAGDVILLRAFAVRSINRAPTLTSADESSWCVWRYKKPVWGKKKEAGGPGGGEGRGRVEGGTHQCFAAYTATLSTMPSTSPQSHNIAPLPAQQVATPHISKVSEHLWLLIDPVKLSALPALDLALLEPQSNLLLAVLDAVGAVAHVAAHVERVVAADGAGRRGERVGGAEDGAAGLDGVTAFPDHGADGAGAHVCVGVSIVVV